MTSLNELAYNIQNMMYGGKANTSANVSIRQIKYWIHYHRMGIIKDNIDRGILNNDNLYQIHVPYADDSPVTQGLTDNMGNLTNYSTASYREDYFKRFPKTKSTSGPYSGKFRALTPYFIPLTFHNYPDANRTTDDLDAYGRSIGLDIGNEGRNSGDWRRLGRFTFYVPRILHSGKNYAVKYLDLSRSTTTDEDFDSSSYPAQGTRFTKLNIPITTKEKHYISKYNRFTNKNQPRAYFNSMDLRRNPDEQNKLTLNMRNLIASPNPGAPKNINNERWFIYQCSLKAIFENPLEAGQIKRVVRTSHGPVGASESQKLYTYDYWRDSSTPYPLPQEYIKDLVERIMSMELNTLKTKKDIISDNLDTTNIQVPQSSSNRQNA